MQPSDSRPPVGRGSGRPWPVAYPVPRATRRKQGLPGAWVVLFQRAVGSDPAGCASRLAHRVETAIAFRLHNALGTQNERYFVAVNPTAHSLACLRIGIFVTADAARLATGVGGSPFTGRVSHPLDGKQSFMTSPHRHSPLTSLAWSHCAPRQRITADAASDTVAVYETATARGATVVIPPARTANVSGHGPRSPARDRTITVVKQLGRRRWKKTSGYHRQSRVENTFFRYKSIIGDGLRARSPTGQGSEVVLGCEILNRMTELGRPVSYRIGR